MNRAELKKLIKEKKHLESGQIVLGLEGLNIAVKSNSGSLLEELSYYFEHVMSTNKADITVFAFQDDPQDYGLEFKDWKREAGKSGRKDAYVDLEDARVVQKVRTGMVFLQSQEDIIAVGECLENDNQVINFINAQYMNYLQNDGHLICHASALAQNGKALGIAGFSGGGKSTLMLDILDDEDTKYVTNDRLFLKEVDGAVKATGIPKLPRVNPGTILNNDNLLDLLDKNEREEFGKIPTSELWDVEEKYDVFIDECYGDDRIIQSAPLGAFLLLNWKRDSDEPCQINKVNLEDKPDLLETIMKSPGPFYQYADGSFFMDDQELDPEPYLNILSKVDVYEATGVVDFNIAREFCRDTILG